MQQTPRERRLLAEFEEMKMLRSPYSLFSFHCAALSEHEGQATARKFSLQILLEGLNDFVEPEEFEERYPGQAPEKYLILYNCRGLVRSELNRLDWAEEHVMQVIFRLNYPSMLPLFIWHTPIWHPNIKVPRICIEGRRLAVGVTLANMVVEIGRMIQYQKYNYENFLDRDAAEWTEANTHLLPIDRRDLLDSRRSISLPTRLQDQHVSQEQQEAEEEMEVLVELVYKRRGNEPGAE